MRVGTTRLLKDGTVRQYIYEKQRLVFNLSIELYGLWREVKAELEQKHGCSLYNTAVLSMLCRHFLEIEEGVIHSSVIEEYES